MLIWIPVDGTDAKESKITTLMDVVNWSLVEMNGGEIKAVTFYKTREEFTEWVDFIIMKNKFESYMEFMEEGMMVLSIREEETITEIIEAFKFKELDEVGL